MILTKDDLLRAMRARPDIDLSFDRPSRAPKPRYTFAGLDVHGNSAKAAIASEVIERVDRGMGLALYRLATSKATS